MRKPGLFRRFVAIFVGALLLAGIVLAAVTGEEQLIGTILFVGAVYAVYLVVLFRKEKAQAAKQAKGPDSPLLRR